MQDILIVDDEADIRDLIADIFIDEGYNTRCAKNSVEAFSAIAEKTPSAIILDIWIKDSDLDGLGILETVARKYPHVPVIMISGHGNIETAVKSLRMGAYDYVEKPFKQDKLIHIVKRSIEAQTLKIENNELRKKIPNTDLLIGNSPIINQLRQLIDKVAPTGSRVFISGAAGSGKEVIAKIIHNKSKRKSAPFLVLNSSGIASNLIESELFGTEDTDDINAPARKIGLLERSSGGTLFIDEITEIPTHVQGKLVRFLQNGTFERVGGSKKIQADIRVISASSKNISEEIKRGRFREDLYYRINVVPFTSPNLKDRKEDIPLISDYFLSQQIIAGSNISARKLSDDAIAAMQAYDWPGNVRQLKNIIEWLLIMSPNETSDGEISSDMLPREIFSSTPATITSEVNTDIMSLKLRQAREVFEKQYLIAQIERFGGNISRTASFVGMERSALHRKLKSLSVNSVEKERVDA